MGGLILLVWLVRWWRRTPAHGATGHRAPWWPWAVLVAVGALAGGAAAASAVPGIGSAGFAGATWGGGAALLAGTALAVAWHLRRRQV